MASKCIVDLGANDGGDTFMYLAQGYYVFAVDANPELADALHASLSPEQHERCMVLNAAITKESGLCEFYINHFSPWSSFDPVKGNLHASWVTDGPTGLKQTVTVKTMPFVELWRAHIQHRFADIEYLKIDVEGQDLDVVSSLISTPIRPKFISCELGTHDVLLAMRGLGYRQFQIVSQRELKFKNVLLADISGQTFPYALAENTSGLFGDDLKDWTTFENTAKAIGELARDDLNWYDLHGRM
jgi:FkbM family methyltransferase